MATIIDALLVTAGFDPKRFAADSYSGAAGLSQTAQNLDMSTERLSAWQKAAERAGGTAEAISAQLRESSVEVARFNRGSAADSLPGFFRNGGNVGDLKDGNTYLLARSRIIADLYQKDRAQAALAAQDMGINEGLFNLFKRGPDELERLLQVQEKRAAISGSDAQAASQLRDRYLDLRDTFESVSVKVLLALMPAFERLISLAQGWGDYLLENRDEIVEWVDGAAQAIVKFIDAVDSAAQAVGGWQNVLLALGALKILSWANSLLSLASALGAVATALGTLGGAGAARGLGALRGLGPAALKLAGRAAAGAALFLFSEDLNGGEQEDLAAMRNPALKRKEILDAVRYFEAKDYTREAAVGVVANLQAQSNLDPRAVGADGVSAGIGLWNPRRQADFKRIYGMDLRESTVEQQLDFVANELESTKRRAGVHLAAATTPAQASVAVYRHFGLNKSEGASSSEERKLAAAAGAIYGTLFLEDQERGAAAAATTAAVAQASAAGIPSSTATTSNTSETHIHGPITVMTQATDGEGVARDLGRVGRSQNLVQQGNTGMF
ncbi:phage tail tip lysozyme [Achromobacter aegrifaciens]|uniref:Phage tail tip lysozyme n=1 Tax=Achromobacter aegrifaciens TaxID=1287736 RepID=A0ABU2D966_ACHAE|nr:phage tail tip lysozyme [Achromobacter aegrifaciens]MDR7944640.1 phage tail tip lysozyme [Achromobacter aegrifaciens]